MPEREDQLEASACGGAMRRWACSRNSRSRLRARARWRRGGDGGGGAITRRQIGQVEPKVSHR
jgi:hypothetical protein